MRIEKDSMGEMSLPENSLWGASTQRAVLNFDISCHSMPKKFIQAVGLIKWACAQSNYELGLLNKEKKEIIKKIAWDIYKGSYSEHFPINVFQTGSATSTNMNVNEVIANQALREQSYSGINPILHPNDDVNKSQSSNDTMPTALHISVAIGLKNELLPALEVMYAALLEKSEQWASIIKIGRTHLVDATPLTLGQEFSGYAQQIYKNIQRLQKGIQSLQELALGGTAVGTGINCPEGFSKKTIEWIAKETNIPFCEAKNHFEAQSSRDDCVEIAGYLLTLASSLQKIANDIRLMSSGPRAGLGELTLPATQPGSSIMPGKVNPVICEMLIQAAFYTNGLCHTVCLCGQNGQFELNVQIPLIAYCLLDAIDILSRATLTFTQKCIIGIQPIDEQCKENVKRSLMLVTALNPYIGYDKAAYVAKKAFEENKTLKDILIQENILDPETINSILDPFKMIHPHFPKQ